MRQLAIATALLLSLPALAVAQSSTTMSPASPSSGSQMPQPENSLPSGAATGMHNDTAGTVHHHVTRHRRHTVHHTNPSHAMSHTVPQSTAQ